MQDVNAAHLLQNKKLRWVGGGIQNSLYTQYFCKAKAAQK